MADLKTKATQVNVEDFLSAVEPASKREDAFTLLKLMGNITTNTNPDMKEICALLVFLHAKQI